jgi:hypothetical protein
MDLRDVSYAMRAVAEVAHAGENLLASMDRSRRGGLAPMVLGVALGVGIAALVFKSDARKRVLEWVGLTIVPVPAPSANGAAAEPRAAGGVAQA